MVEEDWSKPAQGAPNRHLPFDFPDIGHQPPWPSLESAPAAGASGSDASVNNELRLERDVLPRGARLSSTDLLRKGPYHVALLSGGVAVGVLLYFMFPDLREHVEIAPLHRVGG